MTVGEAMDAIEAFELPALEPDGALLTVGGVTPAGRAAEIVQEAHSDARRIAAEAEAAGREAGFAAGLEAAREEIAVARQALEAAAAQVEATREAALDRMEVQAAELGLALARKILSASLEVKPELVVDVTRSALRRVAERDRLVVEVNPDDFALLRSEIEGVADSLGGFHGLEVVAERRVARGGCLLRTTEGEIDAGIDEQLERAAEIVRNQLRSVRG
jgi:flagellar biosynthesis/type III secretory pathway protein FliH